MGWTAPGARPSWICRDERERSRFLDLHAPLVAVNTRILLVVVVCIALGVPALDDPLAMIPAVVGIVVFGAIQRRYRSFRRPEVWVFAALLGGETMIALAVYAADLAHTPAIGLMAWPVAGIAGRFHNRPVAVGTAYSVAAMALALWLADVPDAGAMAFLLPLASLFAVATVVAVHRDSDIRQRGSATIDPLTGMLNRAALQSRLVEIVEQSELTRAPVAVIVADLDHFKAINDEHGHAVGDVVLRDVAYRLRRALRAYDLVYRIGGEEFVVLVLGQDSDGAGGLAETLRAAVAAEPVAGMTVTASFGVAASAPGAAFVWDDVFAAADAALYEAKAAGRDRVRAAGPAVAGPASLR